MKKIKLELLETSVKLIMEVLTKVSMAYEVSAPVISELTAELQKQDKK